MRLHGTRQAPPRRAAAGFTILETVIALSIMMTVGLGAVSFFFFAANYNSGASSRARALALAQERMEEWRARKFNTIAAAETNQTVTLGSTAADEADRHNFAVNTKVVAAAGVPNSKQFVITVTVTPVVGTQRFTANGVTLVLVRGSDGMGTN